MLMLTRPCRISIGSKNMAAPDARATVGKPENWGVAAAWPLDVPQPYRERDGASLRYVPCAFSSLCSQDSLRLSAMVQGPKANSHVHPETKKEWGDCCHLSTPISYFEMDLACSNANFGMCSLEA